MTISIKIYIGGIDCFPNEGRVQFNVIFLKRSTHRIEVQMLRPTFSSNFVFIKRDINSLLVTACDLIYQSILNKRWKSLTKVTSPAIVMVAPLAAAIVTVLPEGTVNAWMTTELQLLRFEAEDTELTVH
jgi:hypothetical protein